MKIKYFSDTDTGLVEFSELEVAETKEINENIYIDLDTSGNLVAMTIEHARQQASLPTPSGRPTFSEKGETDDSQRIP
jgi:uncharacterized protein YuzE